ncbi:MAG: ATP-dependent Clp protease ATP-binding subunit ClpA, partial [Desulfobacterales bacterium]|nr:ATP-dependent Clp protease ATP-binding subunit ClpA [Desulfobacterales bacterium]
RRHEYVSIEHVLYAILNDNIGVDIIENCGGDIDKIKEGLEKFFQERMISIPRTEEYVLQQTLGFQRVIQRAVNHARSAEKQEVVVSDILASIFDEREAHAAYLLNMEGITRLDVLNYVSHEVAKTPAGTEKKSGGKQTKTGKKKANALELFTIDLVKRAALGKLDPLIGRQKELERTMQVLCRRRKNNPVFVGDPGVGKTAMAEGLAMKLQSGDVPDILKNVRIFSLDLGAL